MLLVVVTCNSRDSQTHAMLIFQDFDSFKAARMVKGRKRSDVAKRSVRRHIRSETKTILGRLVCLLKMQTKKPPRDEIRMAANEFSIVLDFGEKG